MKKLLLVLNLENDRYILCSIFINLILKIFKEKEGYYGRDKEKINNFKIDRHVVT